MLERRPQLAWGVIVAEAVSQRTVRSQQLSGRRLLALPLLATITALGAIGCDSSSTMVSEPSPTKCEVTLSTASISASGGNGTLSIATRQECGWTASTAAGWISGITPTSGQGNGQIAFTATANPTRAERLGEIVVNDAHAQVRQEPATCQFTLTSANQGFGNAGGTGTVMVAGIQSCPWTARSNSSWIAITSSASGDGSGSLEFRVAPNSQGARTGTMTIADQQFTITQSAAEAPSPAPPTPPPGPPAPPAPPAPPEPPPPPPPPPPQCTYSVNAQSSSFPFGGGAGGPISVSAAGGCAWTAQSNASWITITSGASGSGNGTATFSVAANTNGLARTGAITVASTTVTVTQLRDPATCHYTLNPSGGAFAYTGGTLSMSVATDSDCSWTSSASAPWIAITSGTGGSGNGSVAFSVAANSGGLARSGSVTVGFTTVSVTQVRDPATCRYSIDPAGASLPSGGGGGSITVTTASDCRWAVSVTSSWLVITSGSSGAFGSGSISWSAGSNTGPPRTAEILVSGQSFEVTQAGS